MTVEIAKYVTKMSCYNGGTLSNLKLKNMNFKGLFIGVDRYSSPRINWLSCAVRDATALHALFSDNLGADDAILLTDEEATRSNIKKHFEDLAQSEEDDVILIYFSGHGSDTHELVTYDADRDRLDSTAIPLDTLLEWFSNIPSKKLICILDCCFSGGIGAKVLHSENKPKSLDSAAQILDQMSGEGRVILTASSATQPAWENSRLGHGYLTYYLLEGLKGAVEVQTAGKVSFYRLLDYLNSRVVASAASMGKEQHPNVRGTIDKAFSFPIFKLGPIYSAAFPESVENEVTADLQSLAVYNFPDKLIESWANTIPSLNELQLDAINQFGLFQGNHLIVSAPTSSGKTMIGELAALKGLLVRKRAIFLFPLKALVNDKYKYFNTIYGEFGYRTIRATGDLSDEVPLLIKGQYDICLMTYEKFTALILGNPHILEQVGTVIIDEVQMIADKSRGANLEFILTLLRVRRKQGIEPQVIALSAVIGDTNGLERWLDAGLLKKTERPVPLDEGIITADGTFRYVRSDDENEYTLSNFVHREPRNGGSQEYVIPLVRKLVLEGKQVIVFRELTGEARGAGKYLAENLGLPPAQLTLDALPTGDPSNMSEALRESLAGGVAIHTSHLSPEERLIIEENFRSPNSEIRVISATTTLAMGINTPAESVVVVGLQHPGNPPQPYSIAEYKNMVGRAGRLGFADRGSSFLLALSFREENEHWNEYINGHPEDLVSRFLSETTDPRSLIVKVLVSAKKIIGGVKQNFGLSASDIIDFLEGSFGVFQQQQRYDAWQWDHDSLVQALANLESHEIITRSENNLYQLTELGWIAGHSGLEVESITRLVDGLKPLKKDQVTDPTLLAASQLTLELENVLFPFNKKGVRKETQSWLQELQAQPIASHVINTLLRLGPDDYVRGLRLKKAAACLFWITDLPLSDIELSLQRHGRKDGAAGQIRSTSSRTRDVIYIVAAVAEHLHQELELSDRIKRLFTRLELGIPSSILEIGTIAGSQLTRGDYQALIKSSLHTIESVENASDEILLQVLNQNHSKLEILRNTVERAREEIVDDIDYPVIPPYEP